MYPSNLYNMNTYFEVIDRQKMLSAFYFSKKWTQKIN